MEKKIEKLKEELKYVLDEKYTLLEYLEDIRTSKYSGLKERYEAKEILNYLYKKQNCEI